MGKLTPSDGVGAASAVETSAARARRDRAQVFILNDC